MEGDKGEKKLDNYNSIVNEIYLRKKKASEGIQLVCETQGLF